MDKTLFTTPLAQSIGWALIHFIWQGAVIGIATAAALRSLAGGRATTRYAVACAGLIFLAIAPVATLLSTSGPGPARTSASLSIEGEDELAPTAPASSRDGMRVSPFAAGARSAPAIQVEPVLPLAVMVWMTGVLLLSTRLFVGWLGVERLKRLTTREVDERVSALVLALSQRLDLGQSVKVLESAAVQVPSVVGWLRPVMLLPVSVISGLPVTHLEAVIAHELAHVRRQDYLVNAAQAVIETLLFYHPVVWWCSHQVRIEREHCCDDTVVQVCGDRLVYATALANLEELRRPQPVLSLSAGGGRLIDRVRRVLTPTPEDSRRSHAWVVVPVIAMVLALVVSAPALSGTKAIPADEANRGIEATLQVVAPPPVAPRAPQAPLAPRSPAPAGVPAPAAPPAPPAGPAAPAPPAPPAPPASPAPPAPPAPPVDDGANVVWSDRTQSMSLSHRGRLTLSNDDTDVVGISPGGHFILTEESRLLPRFLQGLFARRRLELRPREDGSIERVFSIGGTTRPFDPEGRAWLRDVLPQVVRHTAIGAEARVARILKNEGLSGMLAEIGRLETDYVRAHYVDVLSDQMPGMAPGQLADVLGAMRAISSDFEQARALMRIAGRRSLTGEALPAFFATLAGVESDYEHERVLKWLASRAGEADIAEAMLQSAQAVESDYENRRVLEAMAAVPSLSPRTLDGIIRSTSSIGSDYERASALVAVAQHHALTGALSDSYVSAARAIASSYEQRRALDAIAAQAQSASSDQAVPSDAQIDAIREMVDHLASTAQTSTRQAAVLRRAEQQLQIRRMDLLEAERQLATLRGSTLEQQAALAAMRKTLQQVYARNEALRAVEPDAEKLREQVDALQKQIEAVQAR